MNRTQRVCNAISIFIWVTLCYVLQKKDREIPALPFVSLIKRHTIPENSVTSNRIAAPCNLIPAVSFNGMHYAIRYVLHNPHMVDAPVIPPVKEDDVPCRRDIAAVLELPFGNEPFHAIRTEGKFRHDTALQIAALPRTP